MKRVRAKVKGWLEFIYIITVYIFYVIVVKYDEWKNGPI